MDVAFCIPGSLEGPRAAGGWIVDIANKLVRDGFEVEIRGIPYTPLGRKASIYDVLDPRVTYKEAWVHDLSDFDLAYFEYTPISRLFFRGNVARIAGIHAMNYVSKFPFSRYFGIVSNVMGALHKLFGKWELLTYDAVHSITKLLIRPILIRIIFLTLLIQKCITHNGQKKQKNLQFWLLRLTHHERDGMWLFLLRNVYPKRY